MGVSIYYTASRSHPLTPAERADVDAAIACYPLNALIAECGVSEDEYTGEDFAVYSANSDTVHDVVFEGATKLPLVSEEMFKAAVEYWCRLLSDVRRALPDTAWHVHIDDHDVQWVEASQEFDPSS